MFGWLKKIAGGAGEPIAPPEQSLPLLDVYLPEADLRLALEWPCAPITFTKPASIDPFASLFGAVRLSRAGEAWPTCGGKPMWPLCQFNLEHAALIPDALRDLSVITIFIRDNDAYGPTRIIDTADPDPAATWALRSYRAGDALTIPVAPAHGSPLSARMGTWGAQTADFPNHDMAGHVIDTELNDIDAYDWRRPVALTKLGGWPGTIQSEPWWEYQVTEDTWDFVLQIENEPKAGWHGWGNGAAYIARSRERPHLWAIDVQFT